jgi:aerobic-type carbon monoxide dehydrogenase small subunit (CoxS/CutS family)
VTNEYQGSGAGSGAGGAGSGSGVGSGSAGDGWEPLPQGEYDADATAFVQLPPELFPDAAPLAAPGHTYVPPQITVSPAVGATGTDPGATGMWVLPPDLAAQAAAPVPAAPEPEVVEEYPEYRTGEWSIPVAEGELVEDSGEFTSTSVAQQWADRPAPPATLPGGAAAPWADEAWAQPEPEPEPGPEPEAEVEAVEELVAAVDEEPAAAVSASADEDPAQPEPDAPEPDTSDDAAAVAAAVPMHDDHPLTSYVLRVNDVDRPVTDAWIGESLLYVLRERLGLAGAKDGCSQGECGACNVQVDGRLVASCLVPAATTAGSEVRTVEGLAADGQPSDVQRALTACGAVQCGFCVPGMAMTVHDLLEGNPAPSDLETRQALCGNLCRCSGYRGVLDAVRQVTTERQAAAAAESPAEEPRIPHQAGPTPDETAPLAAPAGGDAPFAPGAPEATTAGGDTLGGGVGFVGPAGGGDTLGGGVGFVGPAAGGDTLGGNAGFVSPAGGGDTLGGAQGFGGTIDGTGTLGGATGFDAAPDGYGVPGEATPDGYGAPGEATPDGYGAAGYDDLRNGGQV